MVDAEVEAVGVVCDVGAASDFAVDIVKAEVGQILERIAAGHVVEVARHYHIGAAEALDEFAQVVGVVGPLLGGDIDFRHQSRAHAVDFGKVEGIHLGNLAVEQFVGGREPVRLQMHVEYRHRFAVDKQAEYGYLVAFHIAPVVAHRVGRILRQHRLHLAECHHVRILAVYGVDLRGGDVLRLRCGKGVYLLEVDHIGVGPQDVADGGVYVAWERVGEVVESGDIVCHKAERMHLGALLDLECRAGEVERSVCPQRGYARRDHRDGREQRPAAGKHVEHHKYHRAVNPQRIGQEHDGGEHEVARLYLARVRCHEQPEGEKDGAGPEYETYGALPPRPV